MARWPAFIGGSYPATARSADVEDTFNLYVDMMQTRGGRNPEGMLLPTPGFTSWATSSIVGSRGSVYAEGRLFWVLGTALQEISSTGVVTNRGTVAADGNPAQVVYNGIVGGQLGICSGGNVYRFTLSSNSLSAALLTGGYTHLSVAHGYGLAFNPTTGKVNLSDLNDLGTWGASSFFRRSLFGDPWQAMFVDQNALIWLPGTETFEVWYDTGSGTQPWAPLSGLIGRYGIAAPFAYGVSGLGLTWLSRSPDGGTDVVRTTGSVPKVVTTSPMAAAISSIRRSARITDAECLPYHMDGHTFQNFSFPSALGTAPKTLTYDMEVGTWAKRGQWLPASSSYDVWAPRVHVDAFGQHLVGDRSTGTIWTMDPTVSTDIDGQGIVRQRIAPGITDEHKRQSIDQVELLMDVGVGLQGSGQGSDPQAMLSVSDDHGQTYGNELLASMGRIGQYRKRVYWSRLGSNPETVIKVRWSDPVPVRVTDAWINNQERVA